MLNSMRVLDRLVLQQCVYMCKGAIQDWRKHGNIVSRRDLQGRRS